MSKHTIQDELQRIATAWEDYHIGKVAAEAKERIAELEKSLREIINYAKPKLRSTRDKLVKDGVCLSGSLMHYEVMPHLITIGKKALNLPENGDE